MCSRMFRCGNIFLRDVSRFYSFDKDYWLRVGVVTGDMYAFCSQVYLTGSSFCAAILLAKCRETGLVIVCGGDHYGLFSKLLCHGELTTVAPICVVP